MQDREFFASLIRLHILHHAAQGPIFGLWIIEELSRHGYKISAGTIYPILYGLERKGYLTSKSTQFGRQRRRNYRATAAGRNALQTARDKVKELFGELFEERK
jgi:DNA-binding PadR family transcriptional regulator